MKRISAMLPHTSLEATQSRSSYSLLGAFVSIGGIIRGYDTGQISGFLEMDDFKRRFGQLQPDGTYTFNDVRSGLIVPLLSTGTLLGALAGGPLADRSHWS
ncbi:hypothetical protein ASPSYDRAFT_96064 [Aspergillus sydowii CBS 593.65]|uniref:Major facilitator superfamily (MFS) profile domain-containing protein n=1 Tax=Aspergillus sydowii CBS 593.65 TaxID=1036612 RepID=A0A1L9SXH9_9EURO|nr:uncharacterized protein ASPSYDRAFT_96064 [Aspergillus sydowii CBS 593.65]OJJ51905.1 hypothetical protein ASPSYDRAFT_96064 [Aspergillus sydowii CBS 593.65]